MERIRDLPASANICIFVCTGIHIIFSLLHLFLSGPLLSFLRQPPLHPLTITIFPRPQLTTRPSQVTPTIHLLYPYPPEPLGASLDLIVQSFRSLFPDERSVATVGTNASQPPLKVTPASSLTKDPVDLQKEEPAPSQMHAVSPLVVRKENTPIVPPRIPQRKLTQYVPNGFLPKVLFNGSILREGKRTLPRSNKVGELCGGGEIMVASS